MTHSELIKACKDAERAAMIKAEHEHPGQVLQPSGRYLVAEPNLPFGDCLWDNSMAQLVWHKHRAQINGATAFYIIGVVNVASEKHRFSIGQYIANAATWRVDIDLTEERAPRETVRTIARSLPRETIAWKTPR
jgi:hypothetical protein